jgi:hypothetical protein
MDAPFDQSAGCDSPFSKLSDKITASAASAAHWIAANAKQVTSSGNHTN